MHDAIPQRMQNKIVPVPESGCWLWTGGIDGSGYAQTYFNGRKDKMHRVAYTLIRGPIPEGMEIDHLCRVRSCVNPFHLEAVTHRENVRRGKLKETSNKRQWAKTHCHRGHEYAGENLYIRPSTGSRVCKACSNLLRKLHRQGGVIS